MRDQRRLAGGVRRAGRHQARARRFSCDIYEDGEEIVVRAELGGVDPKDVEVRLENGVLTLNGERKMEMEEKREKKAEAKPKSIQVKVS